MNNDANNDATKIQTVKDWLGEGAINLFGLPMSGKDTQGKLLSEMLGAKFISSGEIIRAKEAENHNPLTSDGELLPTNLFYEWVLPYLENHDLWGYPLILSSIGRWAGEEVEVMRIAEGAGHPIKAVVLIDITEQDLQERWQVANVTQDRGVRADDANWTILSKRIDEFKTKTVPVLRAYNDLDLLIRVNGSQLREAVLAEIIDKLYQFSQN